MKRKSSLVLMELLIMAMVFALAAAFCLQAFAQADRISRDTLHRDMAVRLCDNAAQTVKAESNVAAAAQALGASPLEDRWQLTIPEDGETFLLELWQDDSGLPGLGIAQVRVCRARDGEVLFAITAGFPEVTP